MNYTELGFFPGISAPGSRARNAPVCPCMPLYALFGENPIRDTENKETPLNAFQGANKGCPFNGAIPGYLPYTYPIPTLYLGDTYPANRN